ncbi:MAG: FAD-dependent oxidoreductase, partial [Thermodesulfobacteriota bacterium]
MEKFDLTVIGSGPGGYIGAIRAAQLGMNVAIIERDKPGGVCLNWGCIPSKAILKCAEIYNYINNSEDYGIKTSGISYDYSKVIEKSRNASSTLNKGVEFLFKKNKITLFNGSGKIIKENQIAVINKENKEIQSDKILIATGSVPRTIPGLEIDGKIVMTSDEAIMHREVPKSIVIIGGGYIGAEFAYVYNSFGSKVTIVEMEDHIIPGADEEVAKELQKIFKKSGMEILTKTKYKSIKKQKTSATITIEDLSTAEEKDLKASLVLVAIGRKAVANAAPTSFSYYGKGDSLGLDQVGVELDEYGFIKTDKDFMTTKNNIYAIGDVIGPPLLAHKASEEGVAAVEMMNGIKSEVHYNKIPGCVYCQPEVGTI